VAQTTSANAPWRTFSDEGFSMRPLVGAAPKHLVTRRRSIEVIGLGRLAPNVEDSRRRWCDNLSCSVAIDRTMKGSPDLAHPHEQVVPIAVFVSIALVACAPSPTPAGISSPGPTLLAGKGTNWRVVARATDDAGIDGLALDGKGHIYVTEVDADTIEEFALDGRRIRRWGTTGSAPGELNKPAKIAIDSEDNIYVSEVGNDRIQKFTSDGRPLAQYGGIDQTGPLMFDFPLGMAFDRQGNLYVADAHNDQVQKLSPDGVLLARWSTPGPTGIAFLEPYDLALDPAGDLWLSDARADRIVEISPTGIPIATIGASGSGPGDFTTPRGIAIGNEGSIYVGDNGNNRVQKLSVEGNYAKEWQGPTQRPFDVYTEMVLDDNGRIYVSVGALILYTSIGPATGA
jgi:DNA-binding beta-propeller fold protein YncE